MKNALFFSCLALMLFATIAHAETVILEQTQPRPVPGQPGLVKFTATVQIPKPAVTDGADWESLGGEPSSPVERQALLDSLYANHPDLIDELDEIEFCGFEWPWPIWGDGWTAAVGYPGWDDEGERSYEGSSAAWCAGEGVQPASGYPDFTDSWMFWGDLDLTDYDNAGIDFYLWLEAGAGDYFYVGVAEETDDGYLILDADVYSGTTNNQWWFQQYNLNAYTGQDELLAAWGFVSDENTFGDEGAWVDNVLIDGDQPQADLTISNVSHSPDDPGLGEEVTFAVDIENDSGVSASTFWVDIFYDESSEPDMGDFGDNADQISFLGGWDDDVVYFDHTYNTTGEKDVYVIIDTDNFIPEDDESNNIYGPYTITIGGDPFLTVDDDDYEFGVIAVGDEAGTSFVLSNDGQGEAEDIDYEFVPDEGVFNLYGLTGSLDPGDDDSFQVTFAPDDDDPYDCVLEITCDNGNTVEIDLEGEGGLGELAISPSQHDFGTVPVGEDSNEFEFTLTNNGNATVTDIEAEVGPGFSITTMPDNTLPAGDNTEVGVTFSPTNDTPYSDELEISSSANNVDADVEGVGGMGELTLTPSQHDFGTVPVGEDSDEFEFTLTNNGNATVTDIEAEVGPGFSITTMPDNTLPAGDNTEVGVTFSPTNDTPYSDELEISSSANNVDADVEGVGGAGDLSLTPGEGNFVIDDAGDVDAVTFTLENDGDISVDITVSVSPGEFSLDPPVPSSVDGNDEVEITVEFTTDDPGTYPGMLEIEWDGPTLEADLTGVYNGYTDLSIAPDEHEFDDVAPGDEDSFTFTLSNDGDVAVTGIEYDVDAPFHVENNPPSSVDPNDEESLVITFAPDESGTYDEVLTISSDAGTVTAQLNGYCLTEGTLTVTPEDWTFETIAPGQSDSHQFTLTNQGELPVSNIAFDVDPPFYVSSEPDGVGAGASETFIVSFEPEFLDDYEETLSISASGGIELQVDLEGDCATAVMEQDNAALVTETYLYPVYPNPFNASAEVTFDVNTPGRVTLVVYNVLGMEIARLVDDAVSPGRYNVSLQGSEWPSGTYVCLMTAGNLRQAVKFVLLK